MFARRRDVLEREAERLGALAVQGDLRIPQHLDRLVQATVGAFGGLDIARPERRGTGAWHGRRADGRGRRGGRVAHADLPRDARAPCAAAPARERPRADRRDRVLLGAGADPQPRPLERRPPRGRRLAEDTRARARAPTGSPSTRSRPDASTPNDCATSTATTAPPPRISRRSRSDGSGRRRRSRASSPSSPPIAPRTSPGRSCPSTAASREASSSARAYLVLARPRRRRAPRGHGPPRRDVPVGRLHVRPELRAPGRGEGRGRGRGQARHRRWDLLRRRQPEEGALARPAGPVPPPGRSIHRPGPRRHRAGRVVRRSHRDGPRRDEPLGEDRRGRRVAARPASRSTRLRAARSSSRSRSTCRPRTRCATAT